MNSRASQRHPGHHLPAARRRLHPQQALLFVKAPLKTVKCLKILLKFLTKCLEMPKNALKGLKFFWLAQFYPTKQK